MLKRFKPKARSVLGIDINPTSIKIIELSYKNAEPCLEGYAYERLFSDSLDISKEQLAASLKLLLTKLNSKVAAIAVSDSMAISKTIQLADNLNALEMEELISSEAEKYFAYSLDKMNLDFVILGPSENALGMLDILLVATKADRLHQRFTILSELGLEVKIVDIESYAIVSVISRWFPEAKQPKPIALFNIGYEASNLLVLKNEQPIYVQAIALGLKQLLDATALHYKISTKEAFQRQDQSIKPADYVRNVLTPFTNSLLWQIKKSLQDCVSSGCDAIESIFLAGELTQLPDLSRLIQEETKLPTLVVNPFNQLSLSKKINPEELSNLAPLLIVALGLALRLVDEN